VATTETLGYRVKSLRRSRGLTQQDLATSDIHASYVSLIEAGKRQPTAKTIEAIAQRLGTTADYLVTGIEENSRRRSEFDLGNAQLLLEDGRAAEAAAGFKQLVGTADARIASKAQWGLAAALEAAGDLEGAIVEYESLREEAADEGPEESLFAVTTALSRCYREAGDLSHAIEVGESALGRMRRYGGAGTDDHVNVLLTVAMAYLERGDVAKTQQLLAETQRQVEGLGTPRSRGAAYWNAAVLAGELGDTAESVRLIERAVALFGEGNDERNLIRLRGAFAALLLRHDPTRAAEAATTLKSARDKLTQLGSQVDIAYVETELARALTLTGNAREAVTVARSALTRLEQGMRLEYARARSALAYALAAIGEVAEARAEYLAAASALEAMGARRQAALVWLELADLERSLGDVDQALEAMTRSLRAGHLRAPFPTGLLQKRAFS
jgi:transcriptional regulator with XRE-family HTH domain